MGRFPSNRYFFGLMIGSLLVFLVPIIAMMAMEWNLYTIAWMSAANATMIGMTFFMWLLIKAMYGASNGSST